jgi:hypothetical protein
MLFFVFSFGYSNAYISEKLNEQDEILDSIENEMNSIKLLVLSLQNENKDLTVHSESLEKRIKVCNEKIDELQDIISVTKTALESNKEDVSEIIKILGDMQEELNNYKFYIVQMENKIKRTNVFVQILIPVISTPIIANGIYLYCNGNESYGKLCMIGGASILICAELVWNGGKFIFNLW